MKKGEVRWFLSLLANNIKQKYLHIEIRIPTAFLFPSKYIAFSKITTMLPSAIYIEHYPEI